MPDLLLHTIEDLSFYAIETPSGAHPVRDFLERLDAVGKRDFAVSARILATTVAAGRPPAGRSERVRGSAAGLFELRLTPPGRRGAHARLLFAREGNAIRCAHGVLKRERLSRTDIELAERILRESGEPKPTARP